MKFLHRSISISTMLGLFLATAGGAYAQVMTINSVALNPRVYNDVPGATLTTTTAVSGYPAIPSSISFTEQNVSGSGYANRDEWQFSADGGATPYMFQQNDYFSTSMNVTLTGDPNSSLRKEAGFTFSDGGEFILDTDAHEIVAFGGVLPFYAFPADFVSGETVMMGISYANVGGQNSIKYTSQILLGGPVLSSPWLPLAGLNNNTTLGGYLQVVQDPNDPSNSGSAVFQKIGIVAVPEPSALALLGLGAAFLLRRRRS